MTILITGATLPDGTTTDLLIDEGVIAERGSGLSAAKATRSTPPACRRCRASSTCTRTCASPASSRARRC